MLICLISQREEHNRIFKKDYFLADNGSGQQLFVKAKKERKAYVVDLY